MKDEDADHPLTEARIRRILELEPELRRRTKKDAKKFLRVPRRPETDRGETLTDIVAPQMAGYFRDWDEDPGAFLKDRERMLTIYSAVKAGGVQAVIERTRRLTEDDSLAAGIEDMKRKGFGRPAALGAMLPLMKKSVEASLERLRSVAPAEEAAVKNHLAEIEDVLIFQRQEIKARGPRKP